MYRNCPEMPEIRRVLETGSPNIPLPNKKEKPPQKERLNR